MRKIAFTATLSAVLFYATTSLAWVGEVNTSSPVGEYMIGSSLGSGNIGNLSFWGLDSTGNLVQYGVLSGSVVSPTHGAAVGALDMPVLAAGRVTGTAPLMESVRAQAHLTVEDFGAKGDCSTDDSAAFNAYATFVRAPTGYQAVRAISLAASKCYLVRSAIDFDGLRPYKVNVFGHGSVIVGAVGAAHAIISAVNSNIAFHDLRVISQGSDLYGIQVGNATLDGSGDQPVYMDNVYVIGTFVNAAVINRAAEGSLFTHSQFENQSPGGYGLIEDGMAHWALDTTYSTDLVPQNTQMSFNENTFVDVTSANVSSSGFSPAVWMANFSRHQWIGSYTLVGSASPSVVLYSAFANSTDMLDWDVHSEVGPSSEFFITGTYATPTFFGLHYRNHLDQTAASASVFQLDTGITSVALPNLRVEISSVYNAGVTMFDQPSKYSGSGSFYTPIGSLWNATAGSFGGCLVAGAAAPTCGAMTVSSLVSSSTVVFGAGSGSMGTDTTNGNLVLGKPSVAGTTPHLDWYGENQASYNARLISDGVGQLSFHGANGAFGGFNLAGSSLLSIGHVATYAPATPILSACGTSPTIDADASDTKGTITEGTTATGCTITWNTAYGAAPDCVVSSPNGAALLTYTPSTAALTITNASASGDKFSYVCVQ